MIDANNMNSELRYDPGVCRRAFGVSLFVARADALTKNGDHKKTRFFIEDGIVSAAATTGTFVRIRTFYESLPIICFLQWSVWCGRSHYSMHTHDLYVFLRNCKSDWHPRHSYFFAVQITDTCCSKRNRCSATGVLLRTGHGTAVRGRLVQVGGEPVAGKFPSRHIGCDVLLRGFTILEKIDEKCKKLCFFVDALVLACPVFGALRVPSGDD